MRADDIGAKRLEEVCIPRDGGLRGGVHLTQKENPHKNRHEWVCGLTTSERSDWRRLEYPEMAAQEGEFFSRNRQGKRRRGSYIAQMRGGTVGMRHISARQPSHTDLSKWNTASTWGANTRNTTMRGSGEVTPDQTLKGLASQIWRVTSKARLRCASGHGLP